MHGILALAAFHLAQVDTNNDRSFEAVALEHQNKGLASCCPAMEDIDASNVEGLVAFALLLAPMSLCTPPAISQLLLRQCSGLFHLREFQRLFNTATTPPRINWVGVAISDLTTGRPQIRIC